VVSGMKSVKQARIGDTIYTPSQWSSTHQILPLEGYAPAKQMLFSSIFPVDTSQIDLLYSSVERLCLNDNSVSVKHDQSASLGSGLRCGFLGFLHMEVFMQRLQNEFNMSVVVTSPSVPYLVVNNVTQEIKEIHTVEEFPTFDSMKEYTVRVPSSPPYPLLLIPHQISEPFVSIVLVTPHSYYGDMVEVLKDRRAQDLNITYLDDGTIKVVALVPWQEVVCDMYDQIKKRSSGYANFNYTEDDYHPSSLSKVEIAINGLTTSSLSQATLTCFSLSVGVVCEALSFITHSSKAAAQGRNIASKLKDNLSRQQFEIVLQAKVGNKVR
jgi:translation elongation factor EF-4